MKKWSKNFERAQPKVTVVIAVYNKPKDLKMCLEGYRRQSFLLDHPKQLQLILADDGSGPEIEKLFLEFSEQTSLPATYLSQPHSGWGKLRMLNGAILEAQADCIIFTDGDCVPHKHFVKAHFNCFNDKTGYCGRRVDVMEKLASELTPEDVRSGKMDSIYWLLTNILKNKIEFGEQGFFLPSWVANLASFFSKNKKTTIVGSNFSIHKKWLVELNGFDESFQTPGIGEDTDLERRLQMAGANLRWITYRAIQFHLWHPLTPAGAPTLKTFEMLKEKGNIKALKGLKELKPLIKKLF